MWSHSIARRWVHSCSATEAGSTLIEVILAIIVLATAAAALVGGLVASIASSTTHRQAATTDTLIRSYAELLKLAVSETPLGSPWCLTPPSIYVVPTSTSLPHGYSATAVGVSACPTGGAQFQTVLVTLTPPDHSAVTLQVVVRKP